MPFRFTRTVLLLPLAFLAGAAIGQRRAGRSGGLPPHAGPRRASYPARIPQISSVPVAALPTPEQKLRENADESRGSNQELPRKTSLARFLVLMLGLVLLLTGIVAANYAFRGWRQYPPKTTFYVIGGDPERGRLAIAQHGCVSCHIIPGIRGANGRVGPSLEGFAGRIYIGGQLPNTSDNLVQWIQNPQQSAPGTAMPNLNVPDQDARDIAAYLYQMN